MLLELWGVSMSANAWEIQLKKKRKSILKRARFLLAFFELRDHVNFFNKIRRMKNY